jgi:hypothetical protein
MDRLQRSVLAFLALVITSSLVNDALITRSMSQLTPPRVTDAYAALLATPLGGPHPPPPPPPVAIKEFP